MYFVTGYIDACMLSQEVGRDAWISPVRSFSHIRRRLSKRMQSDFQSRYGTSFCLYENAIIGRIEHEVTRNNRVPVRHSTSPAVSNFGLVPGIH